MVVKEIKAAVAGVAKPSASLRGRCPPTPDGSKREFVWLIHVTQDLALKTGRRETSRHSDLDGINMWRFTFSNGSPLGSNT